MKLFRLDNKGQAMAEYALLTSFVVITGIAVYSTGWFGAVQQYVHDVLSNVSLPMP